ncbi:MAG TPA: 2-amino-4-hydroxy-6-hydroxymethyldihydropteridine diphosphokinase [Candidatus Blautia stercoravium]|nr:2-amino-4-hydroxy-6-hydroxymethyldihydropteridine diphosphokinase [Candidatus Blautia stercoravium]
MKTLQYDEIHVENLEVFANHGVFPEETSLGQKFVISLTMYVDTRKAGKKDCLEESVHYGEVSSFMTAYTKKHPRKLIEAAAEDLAEEVLLQYPLLKGVTLELKKPWAPVGLPLETVSVKITRFWHTAYLGLGSNLGDKEGYLNQAIKELDSTKDCQVEKVSSYRVTEPYGGVEQDDFLNACLKLKTLLSPQELLERLHEIEQNAHRERFIHWGPRTLDLDILLYDDEVLETEDLIIPHVEMQLRDFVLKPMCEIAPYERHPLLGKTMTQLWRELEEKGR